jgi:beta-xylosidase
MTIRVIETWRLIDEVKYVKMHASAILYNLEKSTKDDNVVPFMDEKILNDMKEISDKLSEISMEVDSSIQFFTQMYKKDKGEK